jgi:hypothetical protein
MLRFAQHDNTKVNSILLDALKKRLGRSGGGDRDQAEIPDSDLRTGGLMELPALII